MGEKYAPDQTKPVSADFTINARVMQILARRWIDMTGVEVGTTDGVVLIQGRLEREPKGWGEDDELARERFILSLRAQIRNIPGVADVVMRLHEGDDREAPWAENIS